MLVTIDAHRKANTSTLAVKGMVDYMCEPFQTFKNSFPHKVDNNVIFNSRKYKTKVNYTIFNLW
jgi:hypothetical protein